MECLICSKFIDGDAVYYHWHVNRCLDGESICKEPPNSASGLPSAEKYTHLTPLLSEKQSMISQEACLDSRPVSGLESEGIHNQDGEIERGNSNLENKADQDKQDISQAARSVFSRNVLFPGSSRDLLKGPAVFEKKDFKLFLSRKHRSDEGVPDLIKCLEQSLISDHNNGKTGMALLCSRRVQHISTRLKDWGWGCGYRNAQMLFSSLRHMSAYQDLVSGLEDQAKSVAEIPSIFDFQKTIEEAWRAGHDPPGAEHFKHKLVESKKWIGTTEVYTAFTWLGIRTTIVDFPKAVGSTGTHNALVRWIKNYFYAATLQNQRNGEDAMSRLMASKGSPVTCTELQPLYLQHQGHSRTVVGIDIGKDGTEWLLVFDPGKPAPASWKRSGTQVETPSPKRAKQEEEAVDQEDYKKMDETQATSSASAAPAAEAVTRVNVRLLNPHQPSTSTSGGLFNGFTSRPPAFGKKELSVYKVSLKSLSRKEQYQILYVQDGPRLTQVEKVERKIVNSSVVAS